MPWAPIIGSGVGEPDMMTTATHVGRGFTDFVGHERLKIVDWWRWKVFLPVTAIFFAVCTALPYVRPMPLDHRYMAYGQQLYPQIVVISTVTYGFLFVTFLAMRMFNWKPHGSALLVAGTVGLGLVAGNGTSAGIGEISTFLGLGNICRLANFFAANCGSRRARRRRLLRKPGPLACRD